MRLRHAAGVLAIAALPALFGCEGTPLDKKTYAGNLSGYGPTILTVYTRQGTDEIASVQLQADMFHGMRLHEINDMTYDGKLNFDMARVPGESVGLYPQSPGTGPEFREIESLARHALSQRGTRLQEVKDAKQ